MSQVLMKFTNKPSIIRSGMLGIAFGSNIGAFSFSLPASLAGLLWKSILKSKGIKIKRSEFLYLNMLPLIITSLIGFFSIYIEILVMFK